MPVFYDKLNELLQSRIPFVSVTMVAAIGSVPQEPGTKMLVTSEGLFHGTVGGGKVEKRAIQEAQAMLAEVEKHGPRTRFVEWSLGKDIGMTCGGSVKLYFEVFNTGEWTIVLFGAGHIAQALTRILVTLNCRILCIDPRRQWLEALPESPALRRVHAEDMVAEVAKLPEGAFIALMTMGHATDKPILLEILRTRQFPYLGVIGSRAKAVQLQKDIEAAGLPDDCKGAFFCPMGLDLGNNDPQEIAISIVAQLLQERDRLKKADLG